VIITRDILKSLIKEELSKVKKPDINESIDVDVLEALEAAIEKAYNQMTTPTDVDQVYAGTGEPVSKDPQDMHDRAVKFLMGFVEDVASGERLNSPRSINEDGHSDVPSAVRAMKTIIEDAGQMLLALEQMEEGSLPTWWTNKMAVSASMLNKMRDYLLYPKTMNEGHGLQQQDIDYLSKVIDKSDDKELKKILRFIKKSNIKVDKTKDLSKEKKKTDEGFMDAVKRKIGTMPDDRSTVEKIKSHPEMRGMDKLGPARGPIMSVIEKYASEQEMENILSALEQPAGAAIGMPMKESKD
jgi:hypothetical protein